MIELERTFLPKRLPPGLHTCEHKEICDIYFPKNSHAVMRVRKRGNKLEITKKVPLDHDRSIQKEHTIPLDEKEFAVLSKIEGRVVSKVRYYYEHKGGVAEIDVFTGPLLGLVLIDFEFSSVEEKNGFAMPDFCLVDVTQEQFIAGGTLAGRIYKDIEPALVSFNYKPLFLDES